MTMIATDIETLRSRVRAELASRLPQHGARLEWDASRLRAHQRDALRLLLARALEHSSFHAHRLGHIDPDHFELDDLAGLPTMTKTDMMTDYDGLLTDHRLDRRVVERHLAGSRRSPSLLFGEHVCLA